MTEPIILEIEYKNRIQQLSVYVEPRGYTYRVRVDVNNVPVYFEPDEEGEFRALLELPDNNVMKSVDTELIHQIAVLLQEAFG